MNSRLFSVSVAVAAICAVAPGSATVVAPAKTSRQNAPAPASTAAPNRGMRLIRTGDSRGSIMVTGPSGCSSDGPLSFTGGGSGNYPGGSASGILSGTSNEACDAQSTVGGGTNNVIGGDGGSYSAAIVAGLAGSIELSAGAVIAGGLNNIISDEPPYYNSNLSVIGGGDGNVIGSPDSFIGSGQANTIVPPAVKLASGNSPSAFIGAGYGNSITSDFAVITGGLDNANTGEYATIGGGLTNVVSGAYATIGGGYNNAASGIQAVVAGGYGNVASGRNAMVPGGAYNTAGGLDSFAAGNAAQAPYSGTFVWSDYSVPSGISATAANQFIARSAGGFYLYSSANLATGVKLAPGSGSWSTVSDRAAKTGIEEIDDARILAKVASLPVSEWSYTAQGPGVRHLGPMAQDFRAAFGLGEDEKHISTVDEEGVALASIKALQAEVADKDGRLNDLDQKYALLEQRLETLEKHMHRPHTSGRSSGI